MSYFAFVHDERKLRHILRRNGHAAAQKWAQDHDAEGTLRRLVG